MKTELINKEQAFQKYLDTKDLAFAIAEANGTLPSYCEAPECKIFVACAALATELKEGDFCIFVDGKPAEQLTDFAIAPGKFFIGKICARNVKEAEVENNILRIAYHYGVIEEYSFIEDLEAWRFKGKNISVNVPSTSAN
jgi:hypothetical protein